MRGAWCVVVHGLWSALRRGVIKRQVRTAGSSRCGFVGPLSPQTPIRAPSGRALAHSRTRPVAHQFMKSLLVYSSCALQPLLISFHSPLERQAVVSSRKLGQGSDGGESGITGL